MTKLITFSFSICLGLFTANMLVAQQKAVPVLEHFPSQSQIENLRSGNGIQGTGAPVDMPANALQLTKHFEGWRSDVYNDPNFCTIGYGHLIALKKCEEIDLGEWSKGLTAEAGEALLLNDNRSARLAVMDLVKVDLEANEYGALVDFVFNIGSSNFAKSSLLKFLNGGDKSLAFGEFGRWTLSKGVILNGLVKRRACEATLFAGGPVIDAGGRFDEHLCTLNGIAGSVGTPIDIENGEQQ